MASWLPTNDALPGREDLLAQVVEAVRRSPAVTLVGPPGIGKTALAASAAARSDRPVTRVDLGSCESSEDALRALGQALAITPLGDEAAIVAALRGPPRLLVADGVESDEALDRVLRVTAPNPQLRVLATAETSTLGRALVVPPLPGAVVAALAGGADDVAALEGNPFLARLVGATGRPLAEALAHVAVGLGPLCAFPTGLPVAPPPGLPDGVLRPDPRGWTVPARAVLDRVGRPIDHDAGRAALAALGPLPLAEGATLEGAPDPREILLLRQLARTLPDILDAARCAAACARLLAAAGQVDAARAHLRALRPRVAGHLGAAWVDWADGDALLVAGDLDGALDHLEAAARALGAAQPAMAARLARRTGDRLVERGLWRSAERWYADARERSAALGDRDGVRRALRGTASLALGGGERLGALALLDQARSDAPGEQANERLARATLALGDRRPGDAAAELHALAPAAERSTVLRANLVRRRADLLLRQGQLEAAAVAAREAAALYATVGHRCAQGAAVRLLGDLLAGLGRLPEAADAYLRALAVQVRAQDLHGLARTLAHAAELAEHRGRAGEARQRRDQHAAAVAALREMDAAG